jgi:hypothetical protein
LSLQKAYRQIFASKGVMGEKYRATKNAQQFAGHHAAFLDLYIQYSGLSGTKMPTLTIPFSIGYVLWGLDMRFLG